MLGLGCSGRRGRERGFRAVKLGHGYLLASVCGCEQLTNRTADGSAILKDARGCRWPAHVRFSVQLGMENRERVHPKKQHRPAIGPWNEARYGQQTRGCFP